MSEKRPKTPVGITAVFVATVAALVGLEVADQRIPTAWRESWVWNTVRSLGFSGTTICFWLIFLAFFGIAVLSVWHEYFWPRPKDPCRHCNYEREGLPEGAKCPECGRRP